MGQSGRGDVEGHQEKDKIVKKMSKEWDLAKEKNEERERVDQNMPPSTGMAGGGYCGTAGAV